MRWNGRALPWVLIALLTATALGPTACAGDDSAVPATTPPAPASATTPAAADLELPAGITVFVEFPRYLHATRRIEVAFDNQSSKEVRVTDLALRSPLFEPVASEVRHTAIEVDRRRDLQIGLGAAVCPAPTGPSLVEVTAEIDGVREHGLVEVDSTPLERISGQDCGSEFVLDRVAIRYGPEFTITDGVVDGRIDLERTQGDEPVGIVAMRGSVLIEMMPTVAKVPLAEIAVGQSGVSVPVRLRVIRCDPHAVTESKKTFELAIWLGVGDREPQRLVVEPDGELRAALEQLILDCLRVEAG